MKARTILLLSLWAIVGCTNNDAPLPTLVPTAWIEATPLPALPLPATNTPPSQPPDTAVDEEIEAEAILETLDLETCQEALATQSELEALQEQGQDVTELATAVAELIEELENCETLLTPTPLNE
jgi:hypothetical protein